MRGRPRFPFHSPAKRPQFDLNATLTILTGLTISGVALIRLLRRMAVIPLLVVLCGNGDLAKCAENLGVLDLSILVQIESGMALSDSSGLGPSFVFLQKTSVSIADETSPQPFFQYFICRQQE